MTSKVAHKVKEAKSTHSTLSLWLEDQIKAARNGKTLAMTLNDIETAWSPRFATTEIEELVIPRRTMARRRAASSKLSPEEADRAFRLAQIQTEADRVFGDSTKASRWLRTASRRLNGQTPLSVLRSAAGAILVTEMLVQIDHGMFV
jgi:putative toxin-antitoxin system antitoxin component (TIGR02293 family)